MDKFQRRIFRCEKIGQERIMNPKLSVEYVDSVVVATFTSEKILEDVDIQALEKTLLPLVDQDRKPLIILDFSNVKFLTSSVLGLLIRILKKVNEAGGGLRLCGINAKILEIFNITRLDKVFEIVSTREKALVEFR
ncbi:MAG: STAS domain-containing protein [Phycisphaerae bacterium]|nr:STAS domain-containing protein [Phycisphaerae bacterium]